MSFEENDVRTGRRGAQFVIKKNAEGRERKVYVFQDPISLDFYNVSSGIMLDKKRYHKATMASYLWNQRDHSQLIVPHSRRELTRAEALSISPYVVQYRDVRLTRIPVANAIPVTLTPPSTIVSTPVETPLAAPPRERRRLFPRTFRVDISEDVLIALETVSRWLSEVIEDHGI